MPIYRYSCPTCSVTDWDNGHSVDTRNTEICQNGHKAQIVICAPAILVTKPYFDSGMGTMIHSKGHRQREMASRGLIEVGDYKHMDDIPVSKPEDQPFGTEKEFDKVWADVVHQNPDY